MPRSYFGGMQKAAECVTKIAKIIASSTIYAVRFMQFDFMGLER
jgi:hypothetical protein